MGTLFFSYNWFFWVIQFNYPLVNFSQYESKIYMKLLFLYK